MIQEKLKELELQLNYVCYDTELITRLSRVWDAYYDLKSEVEKLNLPDVSKCNENELTKCENCGDMVKMISSGEFCPHCFC